jgi:hypothetical protein
MDINETFISRGRDNQKPFRLITTLKRRPDRGHEDWLGVFTVDEIGCFLSPSRFHSNQPSAKQIARTVLPKRFKHPAAGCGLNRALINGGLSHHPGA